MGRRGGRVGYGGESERSDWNGGINVGFDGQEKSFRVCSQGEMKRNEVGTQSTEARSSREVAVMWILLPTAAAIETEITAEVLPLSRSLLSKSPASNKQR